KYHWMTIEDYVHFWNLSLFAPGINLVALTILIGKRLGGTWGVFSSLVGLLLPSATITCLLTASFVQIEHVPAVQAILKGIVPATVGVTALVSLRFAQPEFKLARQEGFFSVGAGIFIILACTLATLLWKAPVFIILPAAGLLGIIFFKRHAGSQQEESRTHD
ncbi:MAG TPA: chromate transporter, partial [Ktedonobacteraceae bacterium]|nr:chromate transporter [Ktedonobacteraceae bacterium]